MNFDHKKVPGIINRIAEEKLLIIDWKIHSSENQSVVFQNFGKPIFDCLQQNLGKIKKYSELTFFHPTFTYHPKIAIKYFEKFCIENNLKYSVIFDSDDFKIKKGGLYFLVSDRTLASFLDQCSEKGFEPGREVVQCRYESHHLPQFTMCDT